MSNNRKGGPAVRTRTDDGFTERAPREQTADVSRIDAMSDEELQEFIRSEFVQESLPQIKAPPGWHCCWLTAHSSYDPIHKRMRLGYEPVTFAELAAQGYGRAFETYKVSSGDFAGCVQCNEMVLFKLPMRRYQLIMSEFHHNMPLREEESIRQKATQGQTDKTGRPLVKFDEEDEGLQELGKAPIQAPTFV